MDDQMPKLPKYVFRRPNDSAWIIGQSECVTGRFKTDCIAGRPAEYLKQEKPPKFNYRVEAAFVRRDLDAAETLVTGGVFASLSRRALRSREFLTCRCSASSSTICLTTRVVLSIAVSCLDTCTLNRLFFVSFVNFQFPLFCRSAGPSEVIKTSAKCRALSCLCCDGRMGG